MLEKIKSAFGTKKAKKYYDQVPENTKDERERLIEKKKELDRQKELKKLKEKYGQKDIKQEVLDSIAPPTDQGTSEDILEVFAGIGAGKRKPVSVEYSDRYKDRFEPELGFDKRDRGLPDLDLDKKDVDLDNKDLDHTNNGLDFGRLDLDLSHKNVDAEKEDLSFPMDI